MRRTCAKKKQYKVCLNNCESTWTEQRCEKSEFLAANNLAAYMYSVGKKTPTPILFVTKKWNKIASSIFLGILCFIYI